LGDCGGELVSMIVSSSMGRTTKRKPSGTFLF
jgi:hypothetical protein